MISVFIQLFIIGLIIIIYGILTCGFYFMRIKLLSLLFVAGLIIILLYIISSIGYRYQNKQDRTPLFTYKTLKTLLLLDKISVSSIGGETIYILYDRIPPYYSARYDRVGTYSYFDFLRLRWLYNYQKKRLKDLERKQHKAEVLQRIQETINKEYEKIEQEIAEVRNNEISD